MLSFSKVFCLPPHFGGFIPFNIIEREERLFTRSTLAWHIAAKFFKLSAVVADNMLSQESASSVVLRALRIR